SYLNVGHGHVGNWHAGFRKSFSRPPPLPLEFGQMVKTAKDPADIYALYFDLRREPQLHQQLWDHLDDIAKQTRNERLAAFLKLNPQSRYEAMAGMELMLGMYNAEAKERHPSNYTGRVFIPRVENHPYVHDMHTGFGKALWVRSFAEAWKTKNFEFGDLQANWSGSVVSVLWRERCFVEKGSMRRPCGKFWSWSDIAIPDEDYAKALALERHFYSAILSRVEKQHPHLQLHSNDFLSK
ncbi:MAG TPA: hypothetical protein PKC28_13355, partial [Bdellovibrionales bacterium]|nr:hypothetical protein [Bdellovibrionales bacterium]